MLRTAAQAHSSSAAGASQIGPHGPQQQHPKTVQLPTCADSALGAMLTNMSVLLLEPAGNGGSRRTERQVRLQLWPTASRVEGDAVLSGGVSSLLQLLHLREKQPRHRSTTSPPKLFCSRKVSLELR